MLNVLFIINDNDYGGAKTAILSLAAELKNKINLYALTIDQGPISMGLEAIGVKVFKTQTKVFKKDLQHAIHKLNIDCIHCHGSKINILTQYQGGKISVPIITSMHSDYRYDYNNHFLKKVILTPLNKRALHKMKHIVTMSTQSKEAMIQLGFDENQLSSIPNGIAFQSPAKIERNQCLSRFKLDIPSSQLNVGILVRFHPIKALEVFIEAANRLSKSHPHIHFIIGGDGDAQYTQALHELAVGNNISWLGFINEEDRNYFYQLIDINTITSDSEGLPYVLLEGGMMGIATIASRVGGIPELIQHEVNGLLFEKRDIEAFVKHIITLTSDKPLRLKYSQAIKNTVQTQYSNTNMAEQYATLYNKLINEESK